MVFMMIFNQARFLKFLCLCIPRKPNAVYLW